MRRLLTGLLSLAIVAGTLCAPQSVSAAPTPQASYCTPPNTVKQGQAINAPPLQQNFSHAETCPGQYGDLWTDGPIYDPSFTYFSTSFNFSIPSMVWIANGQRVFSQATSETAPSNETTYWWLSTVTAQFSMTTTNSPPDANSVLEYTITTNSNGITGVTNPTLAAQIVQGTISLSNLPSGSCLQTGAGGVITATGLACGSGSGSISGVSGSGNITANTVSGSVTVGEVNGPTWTGTPSINASTTTGTLNFGSDGLGYLQRTGTNGFSFVSPSSPVLTVGGGLASGSSSYGPTSASVNGTLAATNLTATALTSGLCVQTTTGGALTTASGACATPGISSVVGSGNITANTVSGTTTVGIVNNPTFSGAVGASQFNGSGAGLTSGSIPNVALVTAPVTSVGVSSPLSSTGGTTPTLSVVSSPGFSGTPTAAGFSATGALVAGSATAVIPSAGHNDLSASRSTTTGNLVLGGTGSSCGLDYGVSTASVLTSGCDTTVSGTLTATTLKGTGLTSGNCVQATTGGALTTTGSACGSATSVSSVVGSGPITANTVSGTVTVDCPTCLVGLTAGSNISVSGTTNPTVNVISSPAFSGSIGVDGNSAPAHGIEAGVTTTPYTLTFGGTSSAAESFNLVAPTGHCGTNLVQFTVNTTAEDQFGCNGTLQIGSSTYGGTSSAVAGAATATGKIVAGSATAPTGTSGDLIASRSTTTGALQLGGSSTSCLEDFGVSNGGWINFNCGLQNNGGFYATDVSNGVIKADNYIESGASNSPPGSVTNGDLVSTRSSTSGGLVLGGSGLGGKGIFDYGSSVSHQFTISSSNGNTAFNVEQGYVLASYDGALANAPTPGNGDLASSESATAGKLILGGSTTSGALDFGSSNTGAFTFNADTHTTGNNFATASIEAGSANAPSVTSGDLSASRGASTGALWLGGGSSSCRLDWNVTTISTDNFNCAVKTGAFTASSVKDTGLSASATSLLCGGNTSNISQCTQQSPYFATTGNTSAATGTSANTYVQLGTDQSITTGTSTGANGNWLVTVVEDLYVAAGFSGENVYGCLTSASTFSLQDGTRNGSSDCVTTKTNHFAGAPAFGEQSSSGLSQYGLNSRIMATMTVANATTFTVSCWVAGSTTTSQTVNGYCHVTAIPY